MFGNVDEFRQSHWPPMLQDSPRFSINKSENRTDDAPDAAVNESPKAAITSISPKLNETTITPKKKIKKIVNGTETIKACLKIACCK